MKWTPFSEGNPSAFRSDVSRTVFMLFKKSCFRDSKTYGPEICQTIEDALLAERARWTKYEVALTDCVEALNDFNPAEDRYWNATRKAEALIEGSSIAAKPLMEDE